MRRMVRRDAANRRIHSAYCMQAALESTHKPGASFVRPEMAVLPGRQQQIPGASVTAAVTTQKRSAPSLARRSCTGRTASRANSKAATGALRQRDQGAKLDAVGLEGEVSVGFQLVGQHPCQHLRAKASKIRASQRRAVRLPPDEVQRSHGIRRDPPDQVQPATADAKRPVFDGIDGEFMDGDRHILSFRLRKEPQFSRRTRRRGQSYSEEHWT